jgi:hypothetical protein
VVHLHSEEMLKSLLENVIRSKPDSQVERNCIFFVSVVLNLFSFYFI